jgi:hypothetical protein
MTMIWTRVAALAAVLAGLAAAEGLSFEVYREKVEPIFLKKRPGHARCVVCHEANNTGFRLQQYNEGTPWTEEQSRKNFESVSRLVVPGNPTASKLLMHPLAPEAGGDKFHSGGRQFTSEEDPDWVIIADWIKQAK